MPAELLPRGVSIVHRTRRGRDVRLYQVRVTWQGRRELLGPVRHAPRRAPALFIAQADMLRGVFVPPATLGPSSASSSASSGRAQASRYTVGELADDYLEHVRRLGRQGLHDLRLSPPRRDTRPARLRLAPDRLGQTADEVQHWFDRLLSDHGNGAARGVYMQLSGMFNYATGQ